jgi:hypothetical protein
MHVMDRGKNPCVSIQKTDFAISAPSTTPYLSRMVDPSGLKVGCIDLPSTMPKLEEMIRLVKDSQQVSPSTGFLFRNNFHREIKASLAYSIEAKNS